MLCWCAAYFQAPCLLFETRFQYPYAGLWLLECCCCQAVLLTDFATGTLAPQHPPLPPPLLHPLPPPPPHTLPSPHCLLLTPLQPLHVPCQHPHMCPAADLPLLAAVASSVLSVPLPPSTALMGEVGLGGELRIGQQQLQVGGAQSTAAAAAIGCSTGTVCTAVYC
jgi:hypothetical protein